MEYIKAFIVGGFICILAQILIDKTKLTSGRILVGFVVAGGLLSGVGIYEHVVKFAGSGATVPIVGFGHLLSEGVKSEIDENGAIGILNGGLKAASTGLSAVMLFSFLTALVTDVTPKK